MDGALGTELERLGANIDQIAWSAYAVRESGDLVTSIHQYYIEAGATLHIVNSFSLARHVLDSVGLGHEFKALNTQAMALFEKAVEQSGVPRESLWAAGSLSTFAADSDRRQLPALPAFRQQIRDQAAILIEAGADLLVLEMLFDIETSLAMLDAVREFDVPVIAGFTCEWLTRDAAQIIGTTDMGGQRYSLGDLLPPFIAAIDTADVILAIMHSEFDVTDAAIAVARQHWYGPMAIYPNSGRFEDLRLQFDTVCTPSEFVQAAAQWKRDNIQIIGGCCGIGPAHIKSLYGAGNPTDK